MKNTQKLAEKLSLMEADILTKQGELESITHKLKIAYDYLEVVKARQITANENIDSLQIEYFKKVQDMQKVIFEMKWDVGTFEKQMLNLK